MFRSIRFIQAGVLAALLVITSVSTAGTPVSCAPDTFLHELEKTGAELIAGEQVGYAVAISGGLAAVGAPFSAPGGVAEAGSVYILNADTLSPEFGTVLLTINNPSPLAFDQFGSAVALDGNTLVVGVPMDNPGLIPDAGSAYIYNATTGAHLATLYDPVQEGTEAFGYSVAISGGYVVISSPFDRLGGGCLNAAGTVHVYNATTGTYLHSLADPTPNCGDVFGRSVAVDGDLAVVGAPGESKGATNYVGRVHVFDVTTGAWQRTFESPLWTTSGNYGWSVAISGEVTIGGAPGESDIPGRIGKTWIRNAVTGLIQASTTNPLSGISGYGKTVALHGTTAVVGTIPDPLANQAGRAHLHNATNGVVLATLNSPSPGPNDLFGRSVAVSPGLALIGAPGNDPSGVTDAGSAFAFNHGGGLITTLNRPVRTADDWYGYSVSVSDGIALVGGYPNQPLSGFACTFDALTGAPLANLFNPEPSPGDAFGLSTAIDANTAVVCAPFDDPGGVTNTGRAYVFDATTGAHLLTIPDPAPAAENWFGTDCAISGDRILIGAPTNGGGPGVAYVFDRATGALVSTLDNPAPAAGDAFGYAVDIDDGIAVVGAWGDNPSLINDAGGAYVFNAETGAHTASLPNPSPDANDWFGEFVAISGSLIAVGAQGDFSEAGRVYVFNIFGTPISTLMDSGAAATDRFGPVDIWNQQVIVGARQDDPGGVTDAGSAWIFNANTGALEGTLQAPAPAAGDWFGYAVAMERGIAVVGAPLANHFGISNSGEAYVFAISASPAADCNSNGIEDECEIQWGESQDCNSNGVPDECEPDCNVNGIPDECDISDMTSADCNLNGVPDECELLPFGYAARDSNAPGGPAYDFEDISATGTLLALGVDDVSAAVPIGLSFNFFGDPKTDMYVGSNGYVSFVSGQAAAWIAQNLPNPTAPNGLIAAWWEDLNVPAGGSVHYEVLGSAPNRRMIIQYTDIQHYPGGNLVTMQIKLFEGSDRIEVHYQSLTSDGGTHSAGVENDNGTEGASYYFGAAPLTTPLAVRYEPGYPNDCNENGILDECDISGGASEDCNSNGVPDECEPPPSATASPNPTPTPAPTPSPDATATASPAPTLTPAPSATPTATPCCPGDANNSGSFVDANDFIAVQANFGADNGTGGLGDANCSGSFVDANDFIAVQANFGADCG